MAKNIEKEFGNYMKKRKKIKKVLYKIDVISSKKVAIIVPYRDQKEQNRAKMLKIFLKYIPIILKDIDHKIYIIEQTDDNRKFNRGKLLNIGLKLAMDDKCDILISHDVDLIPCKNILSYYTSCLEYPVHIGDRWKDKYDYSTFIGGILSLTPKLVEMTNGYPNDFWGWGGEDDALYNRLARKVNKICCPQSGCIKELEHVDTKTLKNSVNLEKWENILNDLKNWKQNGVSNLKYKLLKKKDCIYTVKL